MFTKVGDIKVKIVETCLAECKFEQAASAGGFDVCLRVQDADGESDWWRGEFSPNYGKGKMADRTQAQITMQALEGIGFAGGQDFSRLDELVGKETVAHVEASAPNAEGKVYHNVKWLGSGSSAPKAIDKAEAARRMKAIMAQAGSATATAAATAGHPAAATTQPAATAAPKVKNPFL